MTSDKKRLFLAVDLSVATTREIARAVERMRRAAAGTLKVAWVPPANLHVTLKFLGWTHAQVVTAIEDRVAAGVAGRKGFEITARGTGAFPNERNARVLWVGLDDPSGALVALAADVDAWMQELGFEKESRPFSAHVTVGRVKEGRGAEEVLAAAAGTSFGTSLIRSVVLYESRMSSTGSVYTPVARMALDAPPFRAERQTREVEGEATQDSEEPEPHGGQSA